MKMIKPWQVPMISHSKISEKFKVLLAPRKLNLFYQNFKISLFEDPGFNAGDERETIHTTVAIGLQTVHGVSPHQFF